MAATELNELFQHYFQSGTTQELTPAEIKEPDPSALDKIWKQRHDQRESLFNFAVKLTWICFIFLVCVVFFQIWSQLLLQRDLLTGYSLQVLTVGVFGQIIAIVGIIAKSIWDDKPYSKLLDKDHARIHKD